MSSAWKVSPDKLPPARKAVFETAAKVPLFASCGITAKKIFCRFNYMCGEQKKKQVASSKKLEDKARRNYDKLNKLALQKANEMVAQGFGQPTVDSN